MKLNTLASTLAFLAGPALGSAQVTRFHGHDIGPLMFGTPNGTRLQVLHSSSYPLGTAIRATPSPTLPPDQPWGFDIRGQGTTNLGMMVDLTPLPPDASLFLALRGQLGSAGNQDLGRTRVIRRASSWDLVFNRPQLQPAGIVIVAMHLESIVDVARLDASTGVVVQCPLLEAPGRWTFMGPSDPCRIQPRWWLSAADVSVTDPVLEESVAFAAPTTLSIANRPPVTGDRIRVFWRGASRVAALDHLNAYTIGIWGDPHLDLIEIHNGAFGAELIGLGNARLEVTASGAGVGDLTQPGAGVLVRYGRARCAGVHLADGLAIPDGQRLAVAFAGMRGGQEGEPLTQVALERVGPEVRVRQSMNGLFPTPGPALFDLQVLDRGVEVYRGLGLQLAGDAIIIRLPPTPTPGPIGPITPILDYVRRETDHAGGALRGLNLGVRLGAVQSLQVVTGSGGFMAVDGDEVRLRARVAVTDVDWIAEARVTLSAPSSPFRAIGLPRADMPTLFGRAVGGSTAGSASALRVDGSTGGLGRRMAIAPQASAVVTLPTPLGILLLRIQDPTPLDEVPIPGLLVLPFLPDLLLAVGATTTLPPLEGTLTLSAILLDASAPGGIVTTNAVLLDFLSPDR